MKTVVLTAEHEHEGQPRQPGCELLLTDADAACLIALGKAAASTASTARTASVPKATEPTHDKEQQA